MLSAREHLFKTGLKFLACLGIIVAACYPIILGPMIDCSEYKEIQKYGRKGIDQEEIQPGNMKIWSDPFGRK